MSKTTKYICSKCFKSLDYSELIKRKTIIIDNKHKYSHYCPVCNNVNFGILSTVIHI